MNDFVRNYGFGILLAIAVVAIGAYALPWNEDADSPSQPSTQADSSSADSASAAQSEGAMHIGQADFQQVVLDADRPVLVDFYADWCGPCQELAPVIDELARETPGARIVKVDVDENSALASRYQVSAIPTLLVFRNGEVAKRQVGGASKSELRAMLQ
jgi:thioredoxin 1